MTGIKQIYVKPHREEHPKFYKHLWSSVKRLLNCELPALARYSGPAVLAWVPETSAAFTHDPAASAVLGGRLQVRKDPPAPRKGLGGLSAAQLTEELRQLVAMAGITAAGAAPVIAGPSQEPADRLAAWILGQASLGVLTETAS